MNNPTRSHKCVKHEIKDYVIKHAKGSNPPSKAEWKRKCKNAIHVKEEHKWNKGLNIKVGCSTFKSVHPDLIMSRLYYVIKNNFEYRDAILRIIRCLAIPDEGELLVCTLCDKNYENILQHYISYCTCVNDLRNQMWQDIIDILDVNESVQLFSKDEYEIFHIFIRGPWINNCVSQDKNNYYNYA